MRLPLWLKLMLTFMLVVATTLLPVFVFMRRRVISELRTNMTTELTTETVRVRDRLSSSRTNDLAAAVVALSAVLPHRLTLIDDSGEVLADSQHGLPLENHRDRPEVRAALAGGTGVATRRSASTGEELLYVALGLRAGATGPVHTVVRLSRPMGSVDEASLAVEQSVNRGMALALSAAVVLSAIAAVAMTRPLRKLTTLARAYAEGDFGHAVDDAARDEVGDAARSLGEMAVVVRNRLLATGADRATLGAVLDELPLGIVLYDARGEPAQVNGAARVSLALTADAEVDRLAQLARMSPNAEAVSAVLAGEGPQQVRATLPWAPGVSRSVRWLPVFLPDGSRRPALLVLDGVLASQAEALAGALAAAVETLRDEAREGEGAASAHRRARLVRAAEGAEDVLPAEAVEPGTIEPLPVEELRAEVDRTVAPRAESGSQRIVWDLPGEAVSVADVEGRVVRAVSRWLGAALDANAPSRTSLTHHAGAPGASSPPAPLVALTVTGELVDGALRLSVRAPAGPPVEPLVAALGPLGGDAGQAREGAVVHAWVKLARA